MTDFAERYFQADLRPWVFIISPLFECDEIFEEVVEWTSSFGEEKEEK